jgi:hypothetical protein
MIGTPEFPRLTAHNHRITSPATETYKCVAWAAGDIERWWQSGVYWPVAVEGFGLHALERAFRSMGHEGCSDGAHESDFEKVALCAEVQFYTPAARPTS